MIVLYRSTLLSSDVGYIYFETSVRTTATMYKSQKALIIDTAVRASQRAMLLDNNKYLGHSKY
jgi:hypothetical protein